MPRASVLRGAGTADAAPGKVAVGAIAKDAEEAKVRKPEHLVLAVAKPSLSYEETLELQSDLFAGFSDPEFQRKLRAVESRHGKAFQRLTPEHSDLFLSVQNRILPKYGFAEGQRGVLQMLQESAHFNEDEVFRENREVLNRLLGLAVDPCAEQRRRQQGLFEARGPEAAAGALVPLARPRRKPGRRRRSPPLITEVLRYRWGAPRPTFGPNGVVEVGSCAGAPGPRLLAICDARAENGMLAIPASLSTPSRSPPFGHCFLVGSWDDFQEPIHMAWDGHKAYRARVEAEAEEETFQILVGDTSFERRIYPSVTYASPWVPHKALGPSHGDDVDGLDWAIGADPRDNCAPGMRYDILLRCPEGRSISVSWAEAGSRFVPRT